MTIISNCTASIINHAALALKDGHLVAFPTETVYGLGADATNEKAVARIYEVKGRPKDHPLIVHISSLELLDKWASETPEYAIKLARKFWPGPMTLVFKKTDLAKDFITGGQDTVAIRIPSHTLANQLLKNFESLGRYGVVAPSANRFGKVSSTTAIAVELELGQYLSSLDQILDGGSSKVGIESTIIDCTSDLPVILRPGGVTVEMIKKLLDVELDLDNAPHTKTKMPGMLASHYSPRAKVFLSGTPSPGDGYIAMIEIPTPMGVCRLATPKNIDEYAHVLYESLRSADSQGLKRVFIVPPDDSGIGSAIKDRILKASCRNKEDLSNG